MDWLKKLYPDLPDGINPFGYTPELIGSLSAVYNRIFKVKGTITASKNWKEYLPVRERQYTLPFCVSFSRLNCAETLGIADDVKINGSDRELGVGSGTTTTGNTLDAVSEYFRKTGVRSEEVVPFTEAMLTGGTSDDNWKAVFALPADKGETRYKGGSHSYVSGLAAMVSALDYSPLQLAVPVGDSWEDSGVVSYKNTNAYHAIECYYIDENGQKYIYDTIGKAYKILAADYPITACKSFRDLPEDWKATMPMITFVHKIGTSEYGFLETTNFTVVYHRAISEEDIKFQAVKFGVTVLGTDGKINYSLAKDISI